MTYMTLAKAGELLGETVAGEVIYASYENEPILGMIPWMPWMGDGDEYTYPQVKTEMTVNESAIDADYSDSYQEYRKLVAYLTNLYVQTQIPLAAMTKAWNRQSNQVREVLLGMGRSWGKKILNRMINGVRMGATVGATAESSGVDGFQASPYCAAGRVSLKFDDTANTLQAKFPGETAYGAAINASVDLVEYPIIGSDAKNWALLTWDASDSEGSGDWETSDDATGVVLAAGNQIDGLLQLCHHSQRIFGNLQSQPGANGDAFSFSVLDMLGHMLPSARPSEVIFLMSTRTAITYKSKFKDYAAPTVDNWMGQDLGMKVLAYDGKPIVVTDQMPTNMTVGTSTTCTRVACVWINTEYGAHFRYESAAAVRGEQGQVSADNPVGGVTLPGHFRFLPESATGPRVPARLDVMLSQYLKSPQALSVASGITD